MHDDYELTPEELSADERQRLERELVLSDLATVARTVAGQRLLVRLFKEGGLLESSYTGNAATYFNEGQRAFATRAARQLKEADAKAYSSIIMEV